MELKSITSIPNQYPEERDIRQSYVSNGDGVISYYGKFKENKLEVRNTVFDSITIAEGTKFQFLVKFKDGTLYTSPSFYDKIKKITKEVNPYIDNNSLPVILFNDSLLENYSKNPKFVISEQYAEVVVTDTLDTKKYFLAHIDYLTTPDNGSSPLKQATEIGKWTVNTTAELGMSYQEEITKLESEEETYSETEASSVISNPPAKFFISKSKTHDKILAKYPWLKRKK